MNIEQNFLEKIAYSIHLNDKPNVTKYYKEFYAYTSMLSKAGANPDNQILVKVDEMFVEYIFRK